MSVNPHPARERLAALLTHPEATLDIVEAALCISWEDQGEIVIDSHLAAVDTLAEGARTHVAPRSTARRAIAALNTYMFDDLGFRGNTWDYNDPRNSFLDQVIERRVGLPITLSLLYSEVARRLDLPVFGVGLPRHFVVRYRDQHDDFFIDPFNAGKISSPEECAAAVVASSTISAQAVGAVLQPASKRQILIRMLRNLKMAYMQRGEALPALEAIERVLLIDPNDPSELRDRGMLRGRLGVLAPALDDFERYVTLLPRSPDLPSIRRQADALARLLGRRN